MYIDIHKIWWFFNNRCLLRRKHRCTFPSQLKIMISGDLGRLSTKMVVSGIFALNIEVKIAAQSPVIAAVPGVITPPLPPRCWPPRIEMAAANIRKSYRNLRPHFHRRQLMEGVGVLSTQYSVLSTTSSQIRFVGLQWTSYFWHGLSTFTVVSVVLGPFFMPPLDPFVHFSSKINVSMHCNVKVWGT